MKCTRALWSAFLVGIIIYSLKIPILNEIPVYQLVYPLMFLLFIILMFKRQSVYKYVYKPLKVTILCWLIITLWGALLAFQNDCWNIGSYYLRFDLAVVFVSFVLAYYIMIEKYRKWIVVAFIGISGLIALSGIYESITGNFYHAVRSSYMYYKNFLGFYRPNTIFYNINDSATFMFLCLIVTFMFAENCKRKKWLQTIAVFLFGGNIMLVESRGALLAVAIFATIYFMSTRVKKQRVLTVILVTVVIIISFVAFTMNGRQILESTSRIEIWKNSLHNLANSHYLGNGPGMTVLLNGKSQVYETSVNAIHNFFLEILCDYGIIGFVASVYWYIRLVKIAKEQKKSYKTSMIIYAGLISFIPVSISSSSLFGKSFVIAFFALMIAQLNVNEKLCRENQN